MSIKLYFMSIQVNLTEKEILDTPNDMMLGELVRNRYWQARRDIEGPQFDDEHFGINVDENGLVTSLNHNYKCSICGEDTSKVDYDYLIGYTHLACLLDAENKMRGVQREDEHDKCVICGKETPYLVSTHIDLRFFYVEGSGQTCEDCYNK